MNSKILPLAVLFLICSILLPPSLFIAGSAQERIKSSSQASILLLTDIGGNQTVVISNGYYIMNETLTVKENASLLVQNAELRFNMSSSTVLNVYDYANVTMVNSNITHINGYIYIYAYDASSLTVTNSSLCVSSYIRAYDFSKVHCTSSRIYDLDAYDHSTTTIENAQISYVSVEEDSSVLLRDTTVLYEISLEFDSDTTITIDLPERYTEYWDIMTNSTVVHCYIGLTLIRTRVNYWNVYCYDTSRITIQDSILDTCSVQENSTGHLIRCQVNYFSEYFAANVIMEDSYISYRIYLEFYYGSKATLSLQPGHFTHWNLYSDNLIQNAILNLTIQNSNITKWAFSIYNSSVVIDNSDFDYAYIYEDSTLELFNSTCNSIYSYAASHLHIVKSTVNYMSSYDTVIVFAEDSTFSTVSCGGNAIATLLRADVENVQVQDYASMFLTDCNIIDGVQLYFTSDSQVTLISLPIGLVNYWNLYENSSVSIAYINLTIVNSKVKSWSSVTAYENSHVILANCVLGTVYSYSESTVSMIDSFIDYVGIYDHSNITTQNSVISQLTIVFEDDSKTTLSNLSPGTIDYWNIFENETAERVYANYTVINSRIEYWSVTLYDYANIAATKSELQTFECQDHSVGSLQNCTVYYAEAYDNSLLTASSSKIGYYYAYDESSSSITDSEITYKLYVKLKGDSQISITSLPIKQINHWNLMTDAVVIRAYLGLTILNTKVAGWRWYVYGTSFFMISNSILDNVQTYDCSVATLRNCTLEYFYAYDFSKIMIQDYLGARSTLGYAYAYDQSTITFTRSAVGNLYAYEDSYVQLIGTMHSLIRAYDRATIQVAWFLTVRVVDRNNQNVSLASVAFRDMSGTRTNSTLTNLEGIAVLALVEKTVNATGTYPVGVYAVNATQSGHSNVVNIVMIENRELLVQLDFIIPEFLPVILILVLVATTIAVLGAYRLRRRKQSTSALPPPPHRQASLRRI